MVNKIDLLSDGEFIELVSKCSCISDVLRELGYSTNGNSWGTQIVKERMEKLNIFFTKINPNYKQNSIPLEKILIKDSEYNRTKLKERLVKEGLKEYKCECCGITEWNGKPIALQLHHINGIHNDNRLSNLQLLCPNCHSQTENFGTKGRGTSIIRKAESLSKEDIDLIMNTVREVGIVEARKQLTFRNSLINSVVKNHKDTIVMEDLKGNTKIFSTTVEAANYMFSELHLGTSIESIRTGISKCCNGKQRSVAGGYKFYRRSTEE
jgi:Zn finger protein HypA/HybF involved in hydrogenase expression